MLLPVYASQETRSYLVLESPEFPSGSAFLTIPSLGEKCLLG